MSEQKQGILAKSAVVLAITLIISLVDAIYQSVGMSRMVFAFVLATILSGVIQPTNPPDYFTNGSLKRKDSNGGTTSKQDQS